MHWSWYDHDVLEVEVSVFAADQSKPDLILKWFRDSFIFSSTDEAITSFVMVYYWPEADTDIGVQKN